VPKVSRINGYACIALLMALICCDFAAADNLEWQVLTPFPESTKPLRSLNRDAKRLARKSHGRINITFLGTPEVERGAVLDKLTGTRNINAALISSVEYSQLVPNANVYGQLFSFADNAEVMEIRSQFDDIVISHSHHADYVALKITGIGFLYLMAQDKSAVTAGLATIATRAELPDAKPYPSDVSHMENSPIALILNKEIPRLRFLVNPPLRYGYLFLIAKRVDWELLQEEDRQLLQKFFEMQMDGLQEKARRLERRAVKMLRRDGMALTVLSDADTERLRKNGLDINIEPALQSQLQRAVSVYRGSH